MRPGREEDQVIPKLQVQVIQNVIVSKIPIFDRLKIFRGNLLNSRALNQTLNTLFKGIVYLYGNFGRQKCSLFIGTIPSSKNEE